MIAGGGDVAAGSSSGSNSGDFNTSYMNRKWQIIKKTKNTR